jgi:hypothetical protein
MHIICFIWLFSMDPLFVMNDSSTNRSEFHAKAIDHTALGIYTGQGNYLTNSYNVAIYTKYDK